MMQARISRLGTTIGMAMLAVIGGDTLAVAIEYPQRDAYGFSQNLPAVIQLQIGSGSVLLLVLAAGSALLAGGHRGALLGCLRLYLAASILVLLALPLLWLVLGVSAGLTPMFNASQGAYSAYDAARTAVDHGVLVSCLATLIAAICSVRAGRMIRGHE
jgi:hypothetical protein